MSAGVVEVEIRKGGGDGVADVAHVRVLHGMCRRRERLGVRRDELGKRGAFFAHVQKGCFRFRASLPKSEVCSTEV